MPLSDLAVRAAKLAEKPRKLADEKGLYLLINSVGKYWRFDYRFDQKRKTLAFGVYPDTTLSMARTRRDEARQLLAKGADPGANRRAAKAACQERVTHAFEGVAREWLSKQSKVWTSSHTEKTLRRLEQDIFPWLGSRLTSEITAPELLVQLRRIENRGAIETAHRIKQNCSQVFRYAIATGRAQRDPAADLRGALTPVKVKHHASITDPQEIGALLRALDEYRGNFITKCALGLAPLVFVRPGELRKAEWSEFNLETAEWRIPAQRMKMREMHIVPLSKQAIQLLQDLLPYTGSKRYVFPGTRTNGRPMSENTINAALRRLGYNKDEMTGHGFRSIASTLLNEQGWHRDAIERQLAHAERNQVRAAYNYAEHLPIRREMMQFWADYLTKLKQGAHILNFGSKTA